MARRQLPPGSSGNIKATRSGTGWLARCNYRDLNGVYSRPSRRGRTKDDAITNLREHLTTLTTTKARGDVTRDTYFRDVAQLWSDNDLAHGVEVGTLSPGTQDAYLSKLRVHILPRVGALRMFEVKPGVCDELIKKVRTDLSYDSASTVRVVLSAVCDYAVRREAIEYNPVRSAQRLTQSKAVDRGPIKAMTEEQIEKMLKGLAEYAQTKQFDKRKRPLGPRGRAWLDLPDIAETMLATGARMGEALAITRDSVTKSKGRTVVALDAHIVRVTGKGLVRKPGRKGGLPGLILPVPNWSASMFARRKLAAAQGPLYFANGGDWHDPSNTYTRLREALDKGGFEWITSHVWRKTVAKHLDEAGLTLSEIAAQLGNTQAVVQKHYLPQRQGSEATAAALDSLRKGATKAPHTG